MKVGVCKNIKIYIIFKIYKYKKEISIAHNGYAGDVNPL
jgi:hypothetical protein